MASAPPWSFGLDRSVAHVLRHGLDLPSAGRPNGSESGPLTLDDHQWSRLMLEADHHRLDGLLIAATVAGALRAPDVTATRHRLDGLSERERALTRARLWHELRTGQILDALDAAGVEWRVLKGSALARLAYPDPQWRPTRDLDLLVHGHQLDRAGAALRDLGGRRLDPDPVPGWAATTGKGATWVLPDGLEVDLHRLLVWGPLGVRIDPELLWQAPTVVDIAGRSVVTLGVAESLLHACAHLLVLGWRRALGLRDVAQLLRHPDLDPSRVMALAGRWRLEAVTVTALALTEREVGEAAPGPLRDWYRRTTVSRRDALWLRTERPEDPLVGLEAVATLIELPDRRQRAMLIRATLAPAPGTWTSPWARLRSALRRVIGARWRPRRPRRARPPAPAGQDRPDTASP